jgi:hypothetical protein
VAATTIVGSANLTLAASIRIDLTRVNDAIGLRRAYSLRVKAIAVVSTIARSN